MKSRSQSGSLLLEVLAVLALLGVMIPIIYRQISKRNQELSNINMASEIRVAKEALYAYIAANRPDIIADCEADPGIVAGESSICQTGAALRDQVAQYWPANYDDVARNFYDYHIVAYRQLDMNNNPIGTVVYGIVFPTKDNLPLLNWNLRRAARVANLIGADGGILQDGNLVGTAGGWILPAVFTDADGNDYNSEDNYYVAFTGIDAGDTNTKLPENFAFRNLHAWNTFSVGNATENCFTTDGMDRIIQGPNVDKNCLPLFWVGAVSGLGNTDADLAGTDGNVYVRNDLHIARKDNNGNPFSAIQLSGGNEDATNEEQPSIKVLNLQGTEVITLDANGGIIVAKDDNTERMRLQSDKIVYESETETISLNFEGQTIDTYQVQPAGLSVMEDIYLNSRGAKLSELLPNYILQKVYEKSLSSTTTTIEKPDCPTGYTRAIVVFPTVVKHQVWTSGDTIGTVSGTNVKASASKVLERTITIDSQTRSSRGEGSGNGSWTIQASENIDSAIIQTYCVRPTENIEAN